MFLPFRTKYFYFLSFFTTCTFLLSGTTGKIEGVVKSSDLQTPLVGVNIVLNNTTKGTITDSIGTFTLLNIKPGSYVIQATMMGYAAHTVKEVVVRIDQTTIVNIFLNQRSIDME